MRRFFIGLTLSFICHLCFSQPFSNERTARDHFSKNIGTLDPIEGVYDIENKVVARAGAMSQTHRENYTFIICQSSSNKFSIYDVTSGGKAELTALRGSPGKVCV